MAAAISRYERFIEADATADPTPTLYGTFEDAVSGLRTSIPSLRARLEALIAQ